MRVEIFKKKSVNVHSLFSGLNGLKGTLGNLLNNSRMRIIGIIIIFTIQLFVFCYL